jgi:hypothetical protein
MSKKIKVSIIVIASICFIGYIASFNDFVNDLEYTGYYWLFKFDHFSSGDKIYASGSFVDDKKATAIPLYRIMRPLTSDELNDMDEFKKSQLHINEHNIDLNAKPIAVWCHKWLIKSGMEAQHSSFIGTYWGSNYLGIKGEDKNHNPRILHTIFFAIKPNQRVFLDHGDEIYKEELPVNYTWADSTFYIIPFAAANKNRRM